MTGATAIIRSLATLGLVVWLLLAAAAPAPVSSVKPVKPSRSKPQKTLPAQPKSGRSTQPGADAQKPPAIKCPGATGAAGEWGGEWRLPAGQPHLWRPAKPCPYALADYKSRVNCLAGKHVVFLGDSVSRYQYVNLAHYLHTGRWLSPEPANEGAKSGWPGWLEYQRGVSIRLGCQEQCDCFTGPVDVRRESRYFRDCDRRLSLTMFVWYAGLPIKIRYGNRTMPPHEGLPAAAAAAAAVGGSNASAAGVSSSPYLAGFDPEFHSCCLRDAWRCNNVTYFPDGDASYKDAVDFLEKEFVPPGRPKADVLVLNQGLWNYDAIRKNATHRDRLFAAAVAATRPRAAGGRVVWKTTTPKRDHGTKPPRDDAEWLAAVRRAGLEVFDAYAIMRRLPGQKKAYLDLTHLMPPVYAELNRRLLDQLCGGVSTDLGG